MTDHGLKQVGLSIGTRKLFIRNHQMRKAGWKSKKSTSLVKKGALAHRLQRRTACNTAPPATPHRLQHLTPCNTSPPD